VNYPFNLYRQYLWPAVNSPVSNGTLNTRGLPTRPHFHNVMSLLLSGRSLLRISQQCGLGKRFFQCGLGATRSRIDCKASALAGTLLKPNMTKAHVYKSNLNFMAGFHRQGLD